MIVLASSEPCGFEQGIVVSGVTELVAQSAKEVMELLSVGNQNRTTEPTAANQTSSRSHAILQIVVEKKNRTADRVESVRIGKLSLIDLAGSERASLTQNRGLRMIEGANINRSLLALGNCINALGSKSSKIIVLEFSWPNPILAVRLCSLSGLETDTNAESEPFFDALDQPHALILGMNVGFAGRKYSDSNDHQHQQGRHELRGHTQYAQVRESRQEHQDHGATERVGGVSPFGSVYRGRLVLMKHHHISFVSMRAFVT